MIGLPLKEMSSCAFGKVTKWIWSRPLPSPPPDLASTGTKVGHKEVSSTLLVCLPKIFSISFITNLSSRQHVINCGYVCIYIFSMALITSSDTLCLSQFSELFRISSNMLEFDFQVLISKS